MEETLDKALAKIFRQGVVIRPPEDLPLDDVSGGADKTTLTGNESVGALADLARQHYDRALQAQREGNWAVYGDEIKQVGAILAQMTKTPAAAAVTAPKK
jgi:hypothetical protein